MNVFSKPADQAFSYADDSRFADFVFEETLVRGITYSDESYAFLLDIVLAQTHPAHRQRRDGLLCVSPALLVFSAITAIDVVFHSRPTLDPDGSVDFGIFDEFLVEPGSLFRLRGHDWGAVRLTAGRVELSLFP